MYKRMKKWVMVALGCVCVLGLTACSKTVNLNDYLVVEENGYDGYGKLQVYFDDDAFEEDYSKMKLKGGSNEMFDAFYDSAADYVASEFIYLDVEETEGLSNGDKVTIKWKCDSESIKKRTGYSVEYEDVKFEVEGLDEIKSFDVFEGVEVSFSGTAPAGKATVVADGLDEKYRTLNFKLDKSDKLSNGDVVKVSVGSEWWQDPEYFINNFDAMPESFEKEFVVEGLASYVSAVEQIPADMMAKMDSHVQDKLKAYYADVSDVKYLQNMNLLGCYLLVGKGDNVANYKDKNALFVVYEVTATNEECVEGFSYYYYGLYKNLVILEDGTCSVDLTEVVVPEGNLYYYFGDKRVEGEVFEKGSFWYKGYEDLDTLFNKKVVVELDEYDYISTVEE